MFFFVGVGEVLFSRISRILFSNIPLYFVIYLIFSYFISLCKLTGYQRAVLFAFGDKKRQVKRRKSIGLGLGPLVQFKDKNDISLCCCWMLK